MSSPQHQADVITLPHPARVAADIVRTIVATHSEEDPRVRTGVARVIIDMSRRRGLRGTYAPGVGGVRTRTGAWWLAAVCLECAWVGDIVGEDAAASAQAGAHTC